MAAKPIERYVKKQIADQGGWPRILERLGSGESMSAIASTFLRPDHMPISFSFFRRLLYQDPTRLPLIHEAKRIRAEAWADHAMAVSDTVALDRDAVAKAKVQIETRLRLAGLADREAYGEQKQQVNVQVNVADIHLDSLRHRMIEASKPLEQALAESARADFKLLSGPGSSPKDSNGGQSLTHVEQNDTCPTDTRAVGEGSLNAPPQKE